MNNIKIWLKIFHKRNTIIIKNNNGFFINNSLNKYNRVTLLKKTNFILINNQKKTNCFIWSESGTPTEFITKFGTKSYFGTFEINLKNNHFFIINTVPFNHYLECVVASELGNAFNLETLKAQAVVSRSYFYTHPLKCSTKQYSAIDLGGLFQSYKGNGDVTYKIAQAVELTKNEILYAKDHAFLPFFHSTCGGHLYTPAEIWGQDYEDSKYFRKTDGPTNLPNCHISPYYKWRFSIPKKKLFHLLEQGLHIKSKIKSLAFVQNNKNLITDVKIITNSPHLYASFFKFLFKTPHSQNLSSIKITGNKFKSILEKEKFSKLHSCTVIIHENNKKFYFVGFGFGHSVGMCQWGAENLARQGYSYREILEYYFPGIEIIVLNQN